MGSAPTFRLRGGGGLGWGDSPNTVMREAFPKPALLSQEDIAANCSERQMRIMEVVQAFTAAVAKAAQTTMATVKPERASAYDAMRALDHSCRLSGGRLKTWIHEDDE